MARMSNNDECPSRYFSDSSQLTNWILDSASTCHMTPQVLGFVPVSLGDKDKNIEVADGHHVTAKTGQVRINICNNNGDTFFSTLHYVLLAPDLCDRLFSIITLTNSGNTCLFHNGSSTV